MTRRPATPADLDALVAMGERFRVSSPYAGVFQGNAEQMRTLAAFLIASANGIVLVAEDADGLAGMLGALVYPHPFSGALVCGELFWWVEPAKRGIGIRLLRDVERWAKAQGATAMQMIAPTPDVEALYTRLAYQPVERTFVRAL